MTPYQLFLYVCVKNVHLLTLKGGVRSWEPAVGLAVAWEEERVRRSVPSKGPAYVCYRLFTRPRARERARDGADLSRSQA